MKMRRNMKHSAWIAHKDLLEFSRNRPMMVMLFVFPLFLMIMTGYIFPSENVIEDMPVAVVNGDSVNGTQGQEGLEFVASLKAVNKEAGFFDIRTLPSEEKSREQITQGDMTGAVVIPSNFTSNLRSGKRGYVTILYDQSKPQISMQLTEILDSVIEEMGDRRAIHRVNNTTGLDIQASTAMVKPFEVEKRGTVPGDPNYFQFLAPGVMMMVVMFAVMNGLPRAIAHEKEAGTLDGVLAAPTSKFSIIMGKVMAQSVRGMIQGLVVLGLALLLFGVTVHGSMLLVVLLLLLGIFSFIGLGIAITSLAEDEETAATYLMALQFPMMFLSGVFFPIEQMPWYMQYVAKALPLTYAAQAMRKVLVLGAGPMDIFPEIIVLLIFGAVLLALAIPMFKRAMTK